MFTINEITIRPKKKFSLGWSEIWEYRELMFFFAWRDIKVRYKQAALGIFWTLLQPLAMMSIFFVLIYRGLGIPTSNLPAPLYYMSGLLIWNLFNSTITNASQSMINHAGIIKKIYFPRLIIPISALLTASFDFLINAVLFFIMVSYYQINGDLLFSWISMIVMLIIAFFFTALTAFSIGALLSAINVKYRDVRYALPFFIQTLFFFTPVMYDAHIIKNNLILSVLELNPLNFGIQGIRLSLDQNFNFDLLNFPALSILICCILYAIGLYSFRHMEAYFADLV